MNSPEILEAAMMVCFGVAWPIANLRMLRSGRAEGKGCAFTLIIACGYACGSIAKLAASGHGVALAPVFWLYLLNTASVALNLALQWHFRSAVSPMPSADGAAVGAMQNPPQP